MPCAEEIGVEPSEGPPRVNYIPGKLLLADDLQAEQDYQTEKRWRHTRTLHGWGIVCGLEVSVSDHDNLSVIVSAGMAVDRMGREIVVAEPAALSLATPSPSKLQEATVDVVLQYRSQPAAPVPHPTAQEEVSDGFEPSRILDTYELTMRLPDTPVPDEMIVLAHVVRSPDGRVSVVRSESHRLPGIKHLMTVIRELEERLIRLESRFES